MNALEFANSIEHPVIFLVGNGCPAGESIAWIPPETELPFDLDEVEGEVKNGRFQCTNIKFGEGAWDWNSNIYSLIRIENDPETWNRQNDELNSEV